MKGEHLLLKLGSFAKQHPSPSGDGCCLAEWVGFESRRLQIILRINLDGTLLDMYNLSVYYSAKDNTMSYLSDFDYKQKSSYKLEHLMMSEKQALPKAFAAEALSLDRESVGDLFDILVKRVVSHALVFRSDFENALTQQLQDKFFPNKDTQKKIRIQRIQNKRIETE